MIEVLESALQKAAGEGMDGKVEWEVKQENQALLLNLGQLSQLVVDLVDGGSGGI